jgi:hypothetical protein
MTNSEFYRIYQMLNSIYFKKRTIWLLFRINLAYMFRPIRPSSGHQSLKNTNNTARQSVLSTLQHNTGHNEQEETLLTIRF